nr:hypothetical protein [uncultured Carboxylicivirga sp.]
MKSQIQKHYLLYIFIIILAIISSYGLFNSYSLKKKLEQQYEIVEELSDKTSDLSTSLEESNDKLNTNNRQHYQMLDSIKKEQKINNLISSIHKIDLDSFKLSINRISRSEFKNIAKTNKSIKYEELHFSDEPEIEDKNAWRLNDSTFVIKLQSSRLDTIKNDNSSDRHDSFSSYKHKGFVKPINSFLFSAHYHESWNLMAKNRITGKQTALEHHVVISPDQKTMVTYAWDHWTFYSGGLKLYDITNGDLDLKLNYYPSNYNFEKLGFNWSFSNIYITNSNEFVFILQFDLGKGKTLKTYAKLKVEKTKQKPATNN